MPSIPNIRPLKCLSCDGVGLKVRSVPSQLYKNGFYSEAYTCPDCLGAGRVLPPVVDQKTLAGGAA